MNDCQGHGQVPLPPWTVAIPASIESLASQPKCPKRIARSQDPKGFIQHACTLRAPGPSPQGMILKRHHYRAFTPSW